MRTGIALLLLTGCETFFPLTADPKSVTGTLVTTLVENSDSGVPVLRDGAAPPSGVTMTVTVDGKASNLDLAEDGSFTFDRFADDYRIVLTSEIGSQLEVQDDAPTIEIPLVIAGRTALDVPSMATTVGLPDMGTVRRLVSTGQWSDNLIGMEPVSFDWHAAKPSGLRPIGLLDAAQHDRLFLLEYATNTAKETTVTKASELVGVQMTNGGMVMMPMPVDTTANACIRFAPALDESQARLRNVIEDYQIDDITLAYGDPVVGLTALSTPSTALGNRLVINVGSAPESLNTSKDLVFHDPLPGHQHEAMASASVFRKVTLPGATTPASVFSGLAEFTDVAAADATCDDSDLAALDQPLAFPLHPAIGDKVLEADDVEVAIARPGTVSLSWGIDGGGSVDFFEVVLFEVVLVAGETQTIQVRQYLTSEREIQIDDQTLAPGKHYIALIFAAIGRPDARNGDYATTVLPTGFGVVATSLFFVPR